MKPSLKPHARKLKALGFTEYEIARHLRVGLKDVQTAVAALPNAQVCTTGANLADPNRADRVLRRFSFQEERQ
jgi:hypothetical protein